MRHRDHDVFFRSTLSVSLSIAMAMVAVVLIGLWGAYRDLSEIRSALLRAEAERLRSHAARTVARLKDDLGVIRPPPDSETAAPAQEPASSDIPWLRKFWIEVIEQEPQRLYAAVVSQTGEILLHSNADLIGGDVEPGWNASMDVPTSGGTASDETASDERASDGTASDGTAPDGTAPDGRSAGKTAARDRKARDRAARSRRSRGQASRDEASAGKDFREVDVGVPGLFYTEGQTLTGGVPAFGIALPIEINGRVESYYHTGLNQLWFEDHVAAWQRPVRKRWILIVGSIFVVVLLVAVALHRINRRYAALQQAISMAHVKQLSDLGRLVGALAHEIRNPLNAIRLNLHALRNVLNGRATLDEDEVQQAVEESNHEIDRLSELMKTMMGYAKPDQAVAEEVDLNAEIEAIRGFLAPIMERDGIEFEVGVPETPVIVSIDPDRLRQILLNLLTNAREASGESGQVTLSLTEKHDKAEVTVMDSGPGVAPGDRDRIFEAFYSTRDTGTGLGLALVKRFVDEAGGTVVCEDAADQSGIDGAVFRVTLPVIPDTKVP